jgi:hypothetical protein
MGVETPDNEMNLGVRLADAGGRMTSGMHESGAHPAREDAASDSAGGGSTHEFRQRRLQARSVAGRWFKRGLTFLKAKRPETTVSAFEQ